MLHRRPLFIGLDLGTSGAKALALDEHGHTLAVETAPYPTLRRQPGWAEQRPDDWWRATCAALGRLSPRPELAGGAVEALGLSGQMHGAVLVDEAGQPVRDALIWADERGVAELAQVAARLPDGRLSQIAGSAPYASATLAKLLWLRAHEPETFARAARVLLPKDELRRRLTGDVATDPSDASGTLLYDVAGKVWSREISDAAELDPTLLPPVVPSDGVAGWLSADAAAATGLPAGLPVATGGGDAACAALGAGITTGGAGPRVGLLSLGTAGQVAVLAQTPVRDHTCRTQMLCAVTPGAWLVMGAILAGGLALEWLASVTGAPDAAALLAEAAEAPVGAAGLLFLPHLAGTRTSTMDPAARGVFLGLRAGHQRRHLARAAIEGVAFALRDCLEALRGLGLGPDELICVGGPVRAGVWQRTLADVLGVPLTLTGQEHGSAIGAARLGMRAVGASPEAARAGSEGTRRIVPESRDADVYDRLYALYQSVYPALHGTMRALDEVTQAVERGAPGEA